MLTAQDVQGIARLLTCRHGEVGEGMATYLKVETIAHEYAHLMVEDFPSEDFISLEYDELTSVVRGTVSGLRTKKRKDHNEILTCAVVHAAFDKWIADYRLMDNANTAMSGLELWYKEGAVQESIFIHAQCPKIVAKGMALRELLT